MNEAASPAPPGWNIADVLETCAGVRGAEHLALVCGEETRTWTELDRRAAGLAKAFLAAGLGRQSKVAQHLGNCNEYVESVFASLKAGLVPVNTRCGDVRGDGRSWSDGGGERLSYMLDHCDAEAVVFSGRFSEPLGSIRERLQKVRLYLHVDDGTGPCPGFAAPYEEAAACLGPGEATGVEGPWGRSGDDLYFFCTSGRTGPPKAVMWRQGDLFSQLNDRGMIRLPQDRGEEGIREVLQSMGATVPVLMPACPLSSGVGSFTALFCLVVGGCVVTVPGPAFDPSEVLLAVERRRVGAVSIAGEAFGRPLADALDADPGRYDLSSLVALISSGAVLTAGTKRRLLEHAPQLMVVDALSAAEAPGMGTSIATKGSEGETGCFRLGDRATLLDDAGNALEPGSGRAGRLAVSGRLPLGYHKDLAKAAPTFQTISATRYSFPGDQATLEPDGSIRLFGPETARGGSPRNGAPGR